MPLVRCQNTLANLSGNGIKVLSPVLPEVQAREHDRCQKFYHQGQTARRKGAVLIRSVNLAIMMIPPVSILVGVYSILVKFNGINTHWALILVTAAFGLPLSIYLYTNYITAIPRALDEAATIDGANRLQCFLHIILPQLKPVTVTVIIMKGVGAWNDFLYPMYIMQKPKMYTVVLVIKQYFSEASTDLHGAAACCVLAMLPIIALYIFLNKYFIKGAVDSAVK